MYLSNRQIKCLREWFDGLDINVEKDQGNSILVTTIESEKREFRIMHDGFLVQISGPKDD